MMITTDLPKSNVKGYSVESEHCTADMELIFRTLDKAKTAACTRSHFCTEFMTVRSITSGKILATFCSGKEIIVVDPNSTTLNNDVAKQYGRKIWGLTSEQHKYVLILKEKLLKTRQDEELLSKLTMVHDESLKSFEILLEGIPNAYDVLVHKHLSSRYYQTKPILVGFSCSTYKRTCAKGYIATGKYAYKHGWCTTI